MQPITAGNVTRSRMPHKQSSCMAKGESYHRRAPTCIRDHASEVGFRIVQMGLTAPSPSLGFTGGVGLGFRV